MIDTGLPASPSGSGYAKHTHTTRITFVVGCRGCGQWEWSMGQARKEGNKAGIKGLACNAFLLFA